MPVCMNCGTKIAKTDKVCKSCKCPVKKRTIIDRLKSFPVIKTKKQKAKENSRRAYIEELDKMLEYFGEVQALYDSYDFYRWQLKASLQQNRYKGYYRNYRQNRRLYSSSLIFGFLGTILLIVSLILWIVSSFDEAAVWLALSISLLVVSVGSALSIFFEFLTTKKQKSEEKNYYVQMNNIKIELIRHYEAYGNCIIIPAYSNPRIINRIKETILLGLADSPQEAIEILSQKAGVPIQTIYYPQKIQSGAANYTDLFLPGNSFDV